jgi:hypothetical protein
MSTVLDIVWAGDFFQASTYAIIYLAGFLFQWPTT